MAVSPAPLRIGGNTIWGEWFAGADRRRAHLQPRLVRQPRSSPIATPRSRATRSRPPRPPGSPRRAVRAPRSLAWTAATDNVGVASYDVHRATSSGFTPTTVNRVATVTGTSHVDSGLAPGTYYYRVIAGTQPATPHPPPRRPVRRHRRHHRADGERHGSRGRGDRLGHGDLERHASTRAASRACSCASTANRSEPRTRPPRTRWRGTRRLPRTDRTHHRRCA